jgi:hypothetical protein
MSDPVWATCGFVHEHLFVRVFTATVSLGFHWSSRTQLSFSQVHWLRTHGVARSASRWLSLDACFGRDCVHSSSLLRKIVDWTRYEVLGRALSRCCESGSLVGWPRFASRFFSVLLLLGAAAVRPYLPDTRVLLRARGVHVLGIVVATVVVVSGLTRLVDT